MFSPGTRLNSWLFVSLRYPSGDHFMNMNALNAYVLGLLKKLGISAGRNGGFTLHSFRHSFKTICVNARIPREVVDAWRGHAPDRSAGSAYYKLTDAESQEFMKQVPFGTGKPVADVGQRYGG